MENIGEVLDKVFVIIEVNNFDLQYVLIVILYGDKCVLFDVILQCLLCYFNQYKLGNVDLYKVDMLGDVYEYFIK